jgi:hypothetical protein
LGAAAGSHTHAAASQAAASHAAASHYYAAVAAMAADPNSQQHALQTAAALDAAGLQTADMAGHDGMGHPSHRQPIASSRSADSWFWAAGGAGGLAIGSAGSPAVPTAQHQTPARDASDSTTASAAVTPKGEPPTNEFVTPPGSPCAAPGSPPVHSGPGSPLAAGTVPSLTLDAAAQAPTPHSLSPAAVVPPPATPTTEHHHDPDDFDGVVAFIELGLA